MSLFFMTATAEQSAAEREAPKETPKQAPQSLLSRLAWEVYRDLTKPSDVPPSVSLPARAVATARLAWLNRKDY